MKTHHSGRVARRRKFFAQCYDDNPAWRNEHANDLRVFHEIARRIKQSGDYPLTVVQRLADNPVWAPHLAGKTLVSWKVNFNRWHRSFTPKVKQSSSGKIIVSPLKTLGEMKKNSKVS